MSNISFKSLLLFVFYLCFSNFSYGQTAVFKYASGQNSDYFLPVYIDGQLKGLTNQKIELENGRYYLVVQNSEFSGKYIEKDYNSVEYRNLKDVGGFETVGRPSFPSSPAKTTKDGSLSKSTNKCTDKNLKTGIKYGYSDRLVLFWEKGKYGYKDQTGNVVIKAKYQYAEPFIDELNCAIVKKGKKFGLINTANEFIVKPQYYDLKYIHHDHFLATTKYSCEVINNFNKKIISNKSKIDTTSKYYICHSGECIGVYDYAGRCLRSFNKSQIKYFDLDNYVDVVIDTDKNGKNKYWFDYKNREGYIEYDEVQKLTNNTYLTSQQLPIGLKYGFVGKDGKQIVAPVFSYIDIKKWESGEWQLTILEYKDSSNDLHSDTFMLRYDKDINEAEILSLDQFCDKHGNPWASPYSTTHGVLCLTALEVPKFPSIDARLSIEDSSGDIYLHDAFSYIELGNYKFYGVTHIINEQEYLYIVDKSKNKVCKKIAYSELTSFADVSGTGIQIYGVSTLSNGDILLKVNASIVTGYDTYMRDPVYIIIQGQPVALDDGVSERYYYRENYTCVFVLDGKTFNLKHSRIMPYNYDNIRVSKYGGFFACKSKRDNYGRRTNEFEITAESPLLKFTNSCRDDWSFGANEGEGIMCMYENDEYIYMGGYTKNKGYVGYRNPHIYKLDLNSGAILKSRSYKMKDSSIDLFKGGVALMSQSLSDLPLFSLFDNFEEGNIKFVDVTYCDLTLTGLLYNDKYWIIPPVLPGHDVQEHAEWKIYPPKVKYDATLKKLAITLWYPINNGEAINVDKKIDVDANE